MSRPIEVTKNLYNGDILHTHLKFNMYLFVVFSVCSLSMYVLPTNLFFHCLIAFQLCRLTCLAFFNWKCQCALLFHLPFISNLYDWLHISAHVFSDVSCLSSSLIFNIFFRNCPLFFWFPVDLLCSASLCISIITWGYLLHEDLHLNMLMCLSFRIMTSKFCYFVGKIR